MAPKVKYTKEYLGELVSGHSSWSDILDTLGLKHTGSSRTHLKRAAAKHGIDTSHLKPRPRRKDYKSPSYKDSEQLLVRGHRLRSSQLRRAMLEHGIPYVCSCGQDDQWNGKTLVLQAEHKDGDNTNNSPENLEFLCPNCHTQTETWGFKSRT